MPESVVTSDQEHAGAVLEVDEELVTNISALVGAGQRGMVLNLIRDLYPADVARLLGHLSFDRARQLLAWLPPEQGSDVLAELDRAFRSDLLEVFQPTHLTELLDELDTDDAADVLADLPDDVALQVLPSLEDAEDLQELLGYGEETAGGIMATEFVAVHESGTVQEATEEVRRNAEHVEEVYVVFVVDEDGRLVGDISLKQLMLSPADTLVSDIMRPGSISVPTDMDQEEVARIMERYDLVSLPVIDPWGRLVGRITIDDVVDVIRTEAEEDIQLMSGVSGSEEPTDTVWRITRGRLPWLLVGMLGAGLSGLVIGTFEDALEQAVVLATFIPIVMAMAGNAGIQSSAIIVQGLASGDVWSSDVFRRLGKELAVALINGLILALTLATVVFVLPLNADTLLLALTAGLSLFIVILLATCIGTLVPLLLHRVGIDPALATGPFITTSNDIIGLAVFFLLASLIYL